MKVYQIRIKIYLLKDIMAQDVQIMLTRFIDKSLFEKENLGKLHNTNTYKNYCYDLLSPLEKDKIYKKGKIYTLTIRTIDENMAEFFYEVCSNINTREFKGLTAEKKSFATKDNRVYLYFDTNDNQGRKWLLEKLHESRRI